MRGCVLAVGGGRCACFKISPFRDVVLISVSLPVSDSYSPTAITRFLSSGGD